ncbi:helix-turn-helix transcriptional regulator [Geoalkalibacter halelectricus]|uniref:helix-turn-helix transcriptional regulator n=1 Tax=Geoalkalibacter halelectricus TaxID=2847045 RepID=UPI003D1C7AF5
MSNDRYLSVRDVAQRYGVSVATIWRWTAANIFPQPVKLNFSTRWRMKDLLDWEVEQAKTG